ncbi:RdgB/HAM1 family non-canonical purine NTP pyrophosphatase [Roseomonas sp. KE2513]|uniref:RdgB/HAM1 family non-canonical purine NTP pyrophosphatase n=1 Tax=Roseomonas sp. KE2513 TaxID=2479202 RepID=UPI0018DF4E30|nr:RdgB/HAM1 family non-canonical purine NTP pyrophosphatase [Roseomonas sp. KE2513]MBI0535517.1 RdgB/HAM1 family non-canonical purine NTP pyrophosphatase [Roseomonas sp. KE2513]
MSGAHRPLAEKRLVLATHNAGKAREVAALLAGHGIAVVTAGELGLPVPEETETTFIGNASLKALAAARASGTVALADDSGFSAAALDGAPGVYTADWAEQPDGTRDYAEAMAKVERLARHSPDRAAWFSCALVLAWPDGHVEAFLGEAHGRWVWPPRGDHGFGYDPMFVPEGETQTFAEMDPARKHAISHRAAAFRMLEEACLPKA